MKNIVDKWTNRSVLNFAGSKNPIDFVTQKAREIVLGALDSGWSGPPFNPLGLADFLKLEVIARDDISDARTVPFGRAKMKPRIEFNPNRPSGRVRFSIAHEIAHTLFPDVTETMRYRTTRHELSADEWQLEALCNVAAAEFVMPLGSLGIENSLNLDINHVADLRKEFDVSMEALLIRLVNITKEPCAMFSASRIEKGTLANNFRIDYSIKSPIWEQSIEWGSLFSRDSILSECSAIGYTAKGKVQLAGVAMQIECIGLPPYPHSTFTRIAGIIMPLKHDHVRLNIEYLKGNALEPRGSGTKLIAHVVNDATSNWGGSGVAVALRKKWPEVQNDFRNWATRERSNLKLGNVCFFRVNDDITIATMISQRGYGPSNTARIRYAALKACLDKITDTALDSGMSIHMPRIGCGQGGGSWPVIQELITSSLISKGLEVTVYDLPGKKMKEAAPSLFS